MRELTRTKPRQEKTRVLRVQKNKAQGSCSNGQADQRLTFFLCPLNYFFLSSIFECLTPKLSCFFLYGPVIYLV